MGLAAIFTREPLFFQSTFSHHSSEVGKKKKEGGVMLTSLFECVSKERHQECLSFFIKQKK